MAKFLFVCALALLAVSSAAAKLVFGGATSVENYMFVALKDSHKQTGLGRNAYSAVGSTAGIQSFLNQTFLVGNSDNPLNSTAYGQAVSKFKSIYTITSLFSSFSFMTTKSASLKLTAKQISAIYVGNITRWKQVDKSLKGVIVPVGRADGSGSTGVFTHWLSTEGGFPVQGNNPLSTVLPKRNKNLLEAVGTFGVVAALKFKKNTIGYAQTGAGLAAGLYEAALKNTAGVYITAANANLEQAIPVSLPSPSSDWNGIYLTGQPGAQTYPVCSFEYSFWRSHYPKTSKGKVLVKFYTYILSNAGQTLSKDFYFTPIPTSLITVNRKALRHIKFV